MMEWTFAARCKTCLKSTVIFLLNGPQPPVSPVSGEFGFACDHCGEHNRCHADALVRKPGVQRDVKAAS